MFWRTRTQASLHKGKKAMLETSLFDRPIYFGQTTDCAGDVGKLYHKRAHRLENLPMFFLFSATKSEDLRINANFPCS
jgi:hypothetical protein